MQHDNQKAISEAQLVTLAIFFYNQEKFARETIEGALSQTYSPLEIIISDDYSTDKTFDTIQDCLKDVRSPHKIVVNQNSQNLGLAHHVAKVAAMAKGELLVMNGGDDVSLPNRVSSIYTAWLNNDRPSAVSSAFIYIDADGNYLETGKQPPYSDQFKLSSKNTKFLNNFFINKNSPAGVGATTAYHTETVFRNYPGLHYRLPAEDQIFALRSLLERGILYIPEKLVLYRQHANNLSRSYLKKKLTSTVTNEKAISISRRNARHKMQVHLQDINIYTERAPSSDEINAFKRHIEKQIAVLKLLEQWWDFSLAHRLISIPYLYKYSSTKQLNWAIKRLIPIKIYSYIRDRKLK